MSEHIQSVIADLERWKRQIEMALEGLRAMVPEFVPAAGRAVKRRKPERTNERTNERSVRRQPPKLSRRDVRPPGRSAGPDKAAAGELEPRVVEAIKDLGPRASTVSLAKRVKVGVPVVKDCLRRLVSDGRVHLEGTGPRNFRWELGPKIAPAAAPTRQRNDVGEVVWDGAVGRNVSLTSR